MRRRTSVLSSSYLENTFQFVQESSGLRVQAVGSVTAVSAEQSLLSLVRSEAATALVEDLRDSDRDLSVLVSWGWSGSLSQNIQSRPTELNKFVSSFDSSSILGELVLSTIQIYGSDPVIPLNHRSTFVHWKASSISCSLFHFQDIAQLVTKNWWLSSNCSW